MARELSVDLASTMLAIGVLMIAFLLTWRQRVEMNRHREVTAEADRRYFNRQDRRRFRGAIVLALIGLGIGVGGQIDVRAGRSDRIAFVLVWGGVALLLLQLLLMAFLDLWSTRRYADRQRRRLAEERRRVLDREIVSLREQAARDRDGSGRDDGEPPEGGPA